MNHLSFDRADFTLRTLGATIGLEVSEAKTIAQCNANSHVLLTSGHVLRMEWQAPMCVSREERMWIAAAGVGMPTPVLVATGTSHGRAWMVYERLPGSVEAHDHASLREAGELLAALHNGAPRQEFPREMLARPRRMTRYRDATSACGRGELPGEWRYLIKAAAEDWEGRYVVPTHGDFRSENLLSLEGKIVGVVDWSDGCQSTPERDLGSINSAVFPDILSGYLQHAGRSYDISFELVIGHAMARHAALAASGVISPEYAISAVKNMTENGAS